MKRISQYIITVGASILIVIMIVYSKNTKLGFQEGLSLCTNIIVPALLPILILTNALVKSNSSEVFEKLFGKATQMLFHLPKETTTAILFGLIGGYPTGAILTNQLLKDNVINKDVAKRLLRFNFCGGMAFIITAIGTNRLSSTKLGITIFIINVISNIIIAIIESRTIANCEPIAIKKPSFSSALVSSLENSTKSIIIMCGYILFFSSIIKLVPIPNYLYPLIEITNGVFKSEEPIPFSYLCFFLAFGGLCIHLQLLGIIKNAEMKYTDFFIHRLGSATISYFLGKVYEYFFPTNIEVFRNISDVTPKLTQANTALSIVLLFSCVVIIVDLNNKKSKLI